MRTKEPIVVKHPFPELQERVEQLHWIRQTQKEIPNLPSGKLRDLLQQSIESILNGDGTVERHIIDHVEKTLLMKVKALQSQLVELRSLRKISSDDLNKFSEELGELFYSLSRFGKHVSSHEESV